METLGSSRTLTFRMHRFLLSDFKADHDSQEDRVVHLRLKGRLSQVHNANSDLQRNAGYLHRHGHQEDRVSHLTGAGYGS